MSVRTKKLAVIFLAFGFFIIGVYHLMPHEASKAVPDENDKILRIEKDKILRNENDKILPNENDRILVYSCRKGISCGGWADRQKGIVAVYLLANATRSGFKIQIEKPCDVTSYVQPKSRDWRLDKNKIKNRQTEKRIIKDGDGRQLRQNLITNNISRYLNKDVSFVTINSEFSHYIRQNKLYKQQLKWLEKLSMGQIFTTIWQENMALTADLERSYKNFVKQTNGKKLVCAQIRMGRNPTVPNDNPDRNKMKDLIHVLDFLKRYDDPKLFRIFVTTDAEGIRADVKKTFPNTVIDTDGVIAHVDLERDEKKSCEGFRKVILDQHILSTCDVLMISESGVGRHASWVRGTPTNLFCFFDGAVVPCNFDHYIFQPGLW